jgi:hypothetical protein
MSQEPDPEPPIFTLQNKYPHNTDYYRKFAMLVVYLLGLEGDSTVSLKELFIDSKMKELVRCKCNPLQEYLGQNLLPHNVVECNSLVSQQTKRGQMGNVAM